MRRNRNDPVQKKRGSFYKKRVGYTPDRLELIWLKTLPMIGPRTIRAAITTMATKTRISAYSTSPWPFSLRATNIGLSSFPCYFLRRPPPDIHIVHRIVEKANKSRLKP